MTITCLIPAYNEEKNIKNIIRIVKNSGIFDEIIVINDGSVDKTSEKISEEGGVIQLDMPENVGKGGAITAGIGKASSDLICMLDADLVGLTKQHIEHLIEPVLTKKTDVCIGVVTRDKKLRDIGQKAFAVLSGQQCYPRSLVQDAHHLADTRFGLEMALSEHFKKKEAKVTKIYLAGVTHTTKEEKMGVGRGLLARLKMYRDIAKTTTKHKKDDIKDELRELIGD